MFRPEPVGCEKLGQNQLWSLEIIPTGGGPLGFGNISYMYFSALHGMLELSSSSSNKLVSIL